MDGNFLLKYAPVKGELSMIVNSGEKEATQVVYLSYRSVKRPVRRIHLISDRQQSTVKLNSPAGVLLVYISREISAISQLTETLQITVLSKACSAQLHHSDLCNIYTKGFSLYVSSKLYTYFQVLTLIVRKTKSYISEHKQNYVIHL